MRARHVIALCLALACGVAQALESCGSGVVEAYKIRDVAANWLDPVAHATPSEACFNAYAPLRLYAYEWVTYADGACLVERATSEGGVLAYVWRIEKVCEPDLPHWSLDKGGDLMNLSASQGAAISGAILLLWGFAFGARAVIRALRETDATSSTEEN